MKDSVREWENFKCPKCGNTDKLLVATVVEGYGQRKLSKRGWRCEVCKHSESFDY